MEDDEIYGWIFQNSLDLFGSTPAGLPVTGSISSSELQASPSFAGGFEFPNQPPQPLQQQYHHQQLQHQQHQQHQQRGQYAPQRRDGGGGPGDFSNIGAMPADFMSVTESTFNDDELLDLLATDEDADGPFDLLELSPTGAGRAAGAVGGGGMGSAGTSQGKSSGKKSKKRRAAGESSTSAPKSPSSKRSRAESTASVLAPPTPSNASTTTLSGRTLSALASKKAIPELEDEVVKLEKKNLALRLETRLGKPFLASMPKEELHYLKQIEASLAGSNAKGLSDALLAYFDRVDVFGSRRTHLLQQHWDLMEDLVEPTKFTKMALWLLHYYHVFRSTDPTAPQDSAGGGSSDGSLWDIVARELDLDAEQLERVPEILMSDPSGSLLVKVRSAQRDAKELKSRTQQASRLLREEMKALGDILSPEQFARLVLFTQAPKMDGRASSASSAGGSGSKKGSKASGPASAAKHSDKEYVVQLDATPNVVDLWESEQKIYTSVAADIATQVAKTGQINVV